MNQNKTYYLQLWLICWNYYSCEKEGYFILIDISETIAMLFRFLFSYFFLFVWIPALLINFHKNDSTLLDKLFISLTHSTLFFMIAIHLLVGIRLLETFSIFILSFATIVIVLRLRYKTKESFFKTLILSLFKILEVWELSFEVKKWASNLHLKLLAQARSLINRVMRHPFLFFASLILLGVAMVERFTYSFTHLSFASSDSYVHLGWSKYMAHMEIYLNGVYPYGFESILASMYKVFHLDMYIMVRFMGALTAMLMLLSLIYSLRRIIGRDYSTILLAVFLFLYSTALNMNNDSILWRQLSALSMEYSTIFLLPGIAFFFQFFKTKKRYYLVLAAECYAITAFTHPFVTVTMTFAYLSIGLTHLGILFSNKNFIRIIMYMGAAGFIGIFPPILGLLSGKPFHGSSLNYAKRELTADSDSFHVLELLKATASQHPFILVMYSSFILLLILWTILRLFNKSESRWDYSKLSPLLMAAIFHFIMLMSFISSKSGLPSIIPFDRQQVFLSMSTALFFGIGWGFVIKSIKWKILKQAFQFIGCSVLTCWVIFVPGQKMEFPPGDQHQYDEAMRGYLDIKKNYPLKNWVIISPVDELGIIYGYGYHYELWEFVRDLDDPKVKQLEFTTPYAFLYIEKIPIDIMNRTVRSIAREDADMPFPVADTPNLTEFYYGFGYQNRRILQAKAYYWAEDYMKNHDDMKVFLDSPNMRIYEIYQGKDKVILKKH